MIDHTLGGERVRRNRGLLVVGDWFRMEPCSTIEVSICVVCAN